MGSDAAFGLVTVEIPEAVLVILEGMARGLAQHQKSVQAEATAVY